jgi:D-arabinose 1-dehydrogenase-like Zn-dependent alcohol dehydrogenase
LRHPTPHRFALEDIVAAHEAVESGQVTGKAVVEMT